MMKSLWDTTKREDFLRVERQLNHPIRQLIVDNAEGKTVLDCACGSSIDYPLWKEHEYTGVDITHKFLEHGRTLHPEIDTRFMDATNMSFSDASFHTVYCKDWLEHLPPKMYVTALEEMWRVADKVMMVAFYISPKDKPTHYHQVKNFWKNHYNKGEVMEKLYSLYPISVHITENIGYNNSALYVVKKNE